MRRIVVLAAVALLGGACNDDGTRLDTGPVGGTPDDRAREYEGSLTVLESPEHGPQLCAVVLDSYPPQCGGPDVVGWDWDAVGDAESANGTTWGGYHVVGTWADGTFTLTRSPTAPSTGPDGDGGFDPDFSPACDDPDVVEESHGATEFDAAADAGLSQQDGYVTTWVSDPTGDWDGPFTASVIVRPGHGPAMEEQLRARYLGPLCVVERDAPTEAELIAIQAEVGEDPVLHTSSSSANGMDGVVDVQVWVADEETVAHVEDRWGDLVRLHGILQPVS